MNSRNPLSTLESGYELHWYQIKKVLGQGAFGITYLAHDINLEREVAIKEYMPGQFATRLDDKSVRPISADTKEDFEWGLKRFISEARTLTKFEHPNLVRVFNVFEMNGTAYMVMNYEVGQSLQQILKRQKKINEKQIINLLIPLMSGLELMHKKGFVHRDVKPGNIFIRQDQTPVLLDFGSARQTRNRQQSNESNSEEETLTTLVSPGYAPIEQYGSRSERQGPWTDIYGMSATVYKSITGLMPVSAIDRNESIIHEGKDPLIFLSEKFKGEYTNTFLKAVDIGLAFKADDRPQTIPEWRKIFNFSENANVTILDPEGETERIDLQQINVQNQSETETENEEATIKKEEETIKTVKLDKPKSSFGILQYFVAVVIISVICIVGINSYFSQDSNDGVPVQSFSGDESGTTDAAETSIVTEAEGLQLDHPETTDNSEMVERNNGEVDQVTQLLAAADEDLKALRLTSPKNENAFDKFLAVLKLDPGNEQAEKGIRAVASRYVQLAYSAIRKNQLDQAESYIKKALVIVPENDEIAAAKQALKNKQEELATTSKESRPSQTSESELTTADTNNTESEIAETGEKKSMWNRFKDWHEEGKKEREGMDIKESELDKKIKDSL